MYPDSFNVPSPKSSTEMDGKMERSGGTNSITVCRGESVSFSACFYKFSRKILILLGNWVQLGDVGSLGHHNSKGMFRVETIEASLNSV